MKADSFHLRKENEELVKSYTHCIYCKKELPRDPKKRHLDHSHLTGELRGMACCECNLAARESCVDFRLQIYMHNFSGYDVSFIVRYMKKTYVRNARESEQNTTCGNLE